MFYVLVVKFIKNDELDVRVYAQEGIKEEGYLECLRRVYIHLFLLRIRELLRSLHEKVTWGKQVRQFERLPSFLTTDSFTDKRDWAPLLEAIAVVGKARENDIVMRPKTLFFDTFVRRFEVQDEGSPEFSIT